MRTYYLTGGSIKSFYSDTPIEGYPIKAVNVQDILERLRSLLAPSQIQEIIDELDTERSTVNQQDK